MLNIDFVNLGIFGKGKGEPGRGLRRLRGSMPAFVPIGDRNNGTVDSLAGGVRPFLDTCGKPTGYSDPGDHPDHAAREDSGGKQNDGMREHIPQV